MRNKLVLLASANSVHNIRWANYFCDRGWDVTLITWRRPSRVHCLNKNINVKRVIFPPHNIFRFGTLAEVYLYLRKVQPSIIQGHFVGHFGIVAALYAKLTGFKPVVLTAWGPSGLIRARLIQRRLINFALNNVDCVTTTSEYLKKVLHEYFNTPEQTTMAIPWGIDLKIFNTVFTNKSPQLGINIPVNQDKFVIFSPRNASPHYRIGNIVSALKKGILAHPNIYLVICTGVSPDKPYLSKLLQAVEELGLNDKVALISRELKPEEMSYCYKSSDAFISIPKNDQFASCIMEGMACGSIPIVGNLDVYKEYLCDNFNALIVDPENPDDIAKKFIYCIEHPEIKGQFAKINNGIVKERFDWDTNAAKMEILYNRLIKEKDSTQIENSAF